MRMSSVSSAPGTWRELQAKIACTVPESSAPPEEQQRGVVERDRGAQKTAHERGVERPEHRADDDHRQHVHAASPCAGPPRSSRSSARRAARGSCRAGCRRRARPTASPRSRRAPRSWPPTRRARRPRQARSGRAARRRTGARVSTNMAFATVVWVMARMKQVLTAATARLPSNAHGRNSPQGGPYPPAALHDEDDAERTREESRIDRR